MTEAQGWLVLGALFYIIHALTPVEYRTQRGVSVFAAIAFFLDGAITLIFKL